MVETSWKIDYLLTEHIFYFNIFFHLFTVLNNSVCKLCLPMHVHNVHNIFYELFRFAITPFFTPNLLFQTSSWFFQNVQNIFPYKDCCNIILTFYNFSVPQI